jgi:adenosylhomocysteinase
MDGHQVMTMADAAKVGDIFITVTGGMKAVAREHFEVMKDGALVANSGHFNVEVDIEAMEELADSKSSVRPFVDQYLMGNGRKINLLGEGRLINLAAAEGHPSAVMDMSFANQALTAEYMAQTAHTLAPDVYVVPRDIDEEVGKLKLESMGVSIDTLTAEQEKYLSSWDVGT